MEWAIRKTREYAKIGRQKVLKTILLMSYDEPPVVQGALLKRHFAGRKERRMKGYAFGKLPHPAQALFRRACRSEYRLAR